MIHALIKKDHLLRKTKKWIVRIIILIAILGVVLYLALRTYTVQNHLASIILDNISAQYDAQWTVDNVRVDFFDEITIDGLLFLDQKSDTLLASDQVHVDIGIFSLLNKEIHINDITLQGLKSHIYYSPVDSAFNYSFLISDTATEPKKTDPSGKSWTFGLDKITLYSLDIDYENSDISLSATEDYLSLIFGVGNTFQDAVRIKTIELRDGIISLLNSDTSSPEPSQHIMPDLGLSIEIATIVLQDQSINSISNQDSLAITGLSTTASDLKWHGHDLQADIENLTTKDSPISSITDLSTSIQIDQSVINLTTLNLITIADHISSESISVSVQPTVGVEASNLNISLSSGTLTNLLTYLPPSIQTIPNQTLEITADQLQYMGENIKSSNLTFKHGVRNNLNIDIDGSNLTSLADMKLNANIRSLNTYLPDIQKLLPNVTFPNTAYESVKLSGILSIDKDALTLQKLSLEVDDVLSIIGSGKAKRLSRVSDMTYDVDISESSILATTLPLEDTTIIDLVCLGKISYRGTFAGSLEHLSIDGLLESDQGSTLMASTIIFPKEDQAISYKGHLETDTLHIGHILRNDDLGQVTLSLDFDARGSTIADIAGEATASVQSLNYIGYKYQNANLTAKLADGVLTSDFILDDPNAKIISKNTIGILDGQTLLKIEGTIDTLLPHNLYMVADTLSISGDVSADISLPLTNGQRSHLILQDLIFSDNDTNIVEDSLALLLYKSQDTTFVKVISKDIIISADGIFDIQTLPTQINNIIAKYRNQEILSDDIDKQGYLSVEGRITSTQLLDLVLPSKSLSIKGGNIDAYLDLMNLTVTANVTVDSLVYDNVLVDSISMQIIPSGNSLICETEARRTLINGVYSIANIYVNNIIGKGNIQTQLITRSTYDSNPDLAISADLEMIQDEYVLTFDPELILNDEDWTIDSSNHLSILDGRLIINNLSLRGEKGALHIASSGEQNKDYDIRFDSFRIESILDLIYEDTINLNGKISGKIQLKDIMTDIYYNANLTVDSILHEGKEIGKLTISASANQNAKEVSSSIKLTGANRIQATADYNAIAHQIELDADIEYFDMVHLDPLLTSILSNTKGIINGKLNISGDPTTPKINGQITTPIFTTTFIANNSSYTFKDPTIKFTHKMIDIGELMITDKFGSPAMLSGKITHNYFDDFLLALSLDTDKFVFLNTSQNDNSVIYGNVVLDANVQLSGPPELIKVSSTAKTLAGTSVTLSPFSETESILKETFLSYGKPSDQLENPSKQLLKLARQFPFDVDVLLEATDDAMLTFIIDPLTGDKIKTRGKANLKVNLNPNGQQEIYGLYNVSSGSYSFSYGDFVKKEFTLSPGSSIRFNGDPLNAILDISAIYKVNTSTYELIKNDVNLSDSEIKSAKLRGDVFVYLTLKGSLLEPTISLDIKSTTSPQTDAQSTVMVAVDRKLAELRNNPNELNNQVFGLLLFDSFIISDNSNTSLNSVGSNIALGSISALIASQLNKLAGNMIKGVDVNVDLNSYNSEYLNEGAGGNVTELGLSVSKQLLNDRLKITAGGNLNLEENSGASKYSSVVGDFVLEYKLTENGSYRVRVFSKSNYDILLDQNSNKNGVSIYFNKSFDYKTKQ